MDVNVGILVSYDYEFLKNSIPPIYEDADTITLAIDENLHTWNGDTFTIAPSFFEWLEAFDTKNKIKIYRDNFYIPELNALENDTRERNMLAKQMGEGWTVQLDADEYFIDFKGFVQNLKKLDYSKPTQILGLLVIMFKTLDDGILYVDGYKRFSLATNSPDYKKARNTRQMKVIAPYLVLHQTWARTEEELEIKLKNWGHTKDFDTAKYIDFWRSLTKQNYKQVKNFHPMQPKWWRRLKYIPGSNMQEVLENMRRNLPKINMWWIFIKNVEQRIKFKRFFD